MQRIIEQELRGERDVATAKAQFTWEKDEIAYEYDYIRYEINKVRFTGKRWLAGNNWGYQKIYQYEYLENSKGRDMSQAGLENDGISHSQEQFFFATKESAVKHVLQRLEKRMLDKIKEITEQMNSLEAYSEK